jgi:hypothetical protein
MSRQENSRSPSHLELELTDTGRIQCSVTAGAPPMTTDELRSGIRAQPFDPFVLHLADQRRFEVTHPEMVGYDGGRIAVVFAIKDRRPSLRSWFRRVAMRRVRWMAFRSQGNDASVVGPLKIDVNAVQTRLRRNATPRLARRISTFIPQLLLAARFAAFWYPQQYRNPPRSSCWE